MSAGWMAEKTGIKYIHFLSLQALFSNYMFLFDNSFKEEIDVCVH